MWLPSPTYLAGVLVLSGMVFGQTPAPQQVWTTAPPAEEWRGVECNVTVLGECLQHFGGGNIMSYAWLMMGKMYKFLNSGEMDTGAMFEMCEKVGPLMTCLEERLPQCEMQGIDMKTATKGCKTAELMFGSQFCGDKAGEAGLAEIQARGISSCGQKFPAIIGRMTGVMNNNGKEKNVVGSMDEMKDALIHKLQGSMTSMGEESNKNCTEMELFMGCAMYEYKQTCVSANLSAGNEMYDFYLSMTQSDCDSTVSLDTMLDRFYSVYIAGPTTPSTTTLTPRPTILTTTTAAINLIPVTPNPSSAMTFENPMLIGLVAGGAVILLIAIAVFVFCRCRRQGSRDSGKDSEKGGSATGKRSASRSSSASSVSGRTLVSSAPSTRTTNSSKTPSRTSSASSVSGKVSTKSQK